MIPFLNLRDAYLELKSEIDAAILRVLDSGCYILGPEVEAFEREYAAYCQARHCVGLADGLDALYLGLKAMGVGPGDEVIVPSNTYIATWLAVSQCGAVPVPVEPDERTYNINPWLIEKAISANTKVILPVHLYGQPADMEPILAIAKKQGLLVLEDGAQAHGAEYKGRRIGAHGDIVTWSFYPGKNLGAMGDGGAITTDNAELADKIRVLRNYGSRVKYVNEVQGCNSRLDPIHAAVLRVKLKYLDEWNARRAALAAQYLQGLKDSDLVLPYVPEWAKPAWHLFVVRSKQRDSLQRLLEENDVGSLIHYPVPPYKQQAYADSYFAIDSFPLANAMAEEVLSLPMGPQLHSESIAEVVRTLIEKNGYRYQ